MALKQLSTKEYKSLNLLNDHIFSSVEFNELHKHKCEDLIYLVYQNKKHLLGLIAGIQNNQLLAPFSAPYGGLSASRTDIKLPFFEEFINELEGFVRQKLLKQVNFILPPYFYNLNYHTKLYYALMKNGYKALNSDINYHFDKDDLIKYKKNEIDRSTRNNLRRSKKSGLHFIKVEDNIQKTLAYDIIQENKKSKNRPIHLNFAELNRIEKIVDIDYFLVLLNNIAIASAIAYHVSSEIVQIIYWGDIRYYSQYRPMNFLAYKILEYYVNNNVKIVDLGTSTLNGKPIYGLCNFNENIGSIPSIKYTFIKEF